MVARISESWKSKVIEAINTYHAHHTPFEFISDHPLTTKWLIVKLNAQHVPFSKINMGNGVYRFTTDTTICPKCNGSGHI
jgi:hypothetical protein